MDLEQLKNIIAIFESSSLSELELEAKGVRFHLTKYVNTARNSAPDEPVIHREIELHPAHEQGEKINEEEITVKSPLVGTFYQARSPSEDPFTEVGEHVHPGQTLCIIEAMKVMNEISCDISGKIKSILVESGQAVEYDQELFVIKKEE